MLDYFSITSDSKLVHRGKKGVITYVHRNGTWKSTKTPDETQAKMLQRKWDNDLFHSDNGLVNRNKSWSDLKQEYLASYRSDRVQTLAKLNNTIKKFEAALGLTGAEKLMSLSMQKCEIWIKARLRVNLPQSVDTERRYLAPMFEKALHWGYIDKNPFADIKRLKFTIPEAVSLSVDEALRSLAMLDQHEPDRLLLGEFAYETGMRLGEIARQRIEDVDFAGAFIKVEPHMKGCKCWHCEREGSVGWMGKAGVPRLIPLSPRLGAKLLAFYQNQKTGCIFPYALNTIIGILRRAHRHAGIKGRVATHVWRHTMSTHMDKAGIPQSVNDKILGHAREVYIHVDKGDMHAAFQKLQDWREGQRTRVQTSTVNGLQVIEAAS